MLGQFVLGFFCAGGSVWPAELQAQQTKQTQTQPSTQTQVGPNGVGKTMLAQNICYQAVLRGIPTLLTTASALLADLSQQAVCGMARDIP